MINTFSAKNSSKKFKLQEELLWELKNSKNNMQKQIKAFQVVKIIAMDLN